MAAIEDLKTEWLTQIATIEDSLLKAEAPAALDRYIAAYSEQSELEAEGIESYSIAGRSVTHRKPENGTSLVAQLRAQLNRLVYGKTSLVNLNITGPRSTPE